MNNCSHNLFYISLLTILMLSSTAHAYRAITYELNRGRLGDHLLTIIRCLTVAQAKGLLVLHKKFEFSDQLSIHELEPSCLGLEHLNIPTKKITTPDDILAHEKNHDIIYVTDLKFQNFLTDSKLTESFNQLHEHIFNNKRLRKRLQKILSPTIPVTPIKRPDSMFSVALHLRHGGGYDRPLFSEQTYHDHRHLVNYNQWFFTKQHIPQVKGCKKHTNFMGTTPHEHNISEKKPSQPYNYVSSSHWKDTHYAFADVGHPTRFPPLQFYIDQIQFLYESLNKEPLFIHIFTDHPNPPQLVDEIKMQIKADNIIYSYREQGNSHNSNVIEDLFAMMEFDCLIRPGSSYSKIAQLLGNHKVIIYPSKATWLEEKKLLMSEVGVIYKE